MSTFFKSIEQIVGQVELQFNIKAKDGKLTVMVMPKAAIKDAAISNIQPLFITGTAEELDAGFLEAVLNPLEQAAGIVHNVASFEAGTHKFSSESALGKKEADIEKKKKDERAKKLNALTAKADEFEKENKFKDAIGALKQAKEFADKPENLDKRITELMAKLSQGSIFDTTPVEENNTNYLEDYKEEPAELEGDVINEESANDDIDDQDPDQEGEND
jgi:PRTRC genetic system protein E